MENTKIEYPTTTFSSKDAFIEALDEKLNQYGTHAHVTCVILVKDDTPIPAHCTELSLVLNLKGRKIVQEFVLPVGHEL